MNMVAYFGSIIVTNCVQGSNNYALANIIYSVIVAPIACNFCNYNEALALSLFLSNLFSVLIEKSFRSIIALATI